MKMYGFAVYQSLVRTSRRSILYKFLVDYKKIYMYRSSEKENQKLGYRNIFKINNFFYEKYRKCSYHTKTSLML
nr:unnamed protein product [Callosobruchus analis]